MEEESYGRREENLDCQLEGGDVGRWEGVAVGVKSGQKVFSQLALGLFLFVFCLQLFFSFESVCLYDVTSKF